MDDDDEIPADIWATASEVIERASAEAQENVAYLFVEKVAEALFAERRRSALVGPGSLDADMRNLAAVVACQKKWRDRVRSDPTSLDPAVRETMAGEWMRDILSSMPRDD